jgi:hypothetical protein
METRTYTAKFKVGDRVRYNQLLPRWDGSNEALHGKTGIVTRVIFPGDIMYDAWGLANGTGTIQYGVRVDEEHPNTKTRDFLFSEMHLTPVE